MSKRATLHKHKSIMFSLQNNRGIFWHASLFMHTFVTDVVTCAAVAPAFTEGRGQVDRGCQRGRGILDFRNHLTLDCF